MKKKNPRQLRYAKLEGNQDEQAEFPGALRVLTVNSPEQNKIIKIKLTEMLSKEGIINFHLQESELARGKSKTGGMEFVLYDFELQKRHLRGDEWRKIYAHPGKIFSDDRDLTRLSEPYESSAEIYASEVSGLEFVSSLKRK